jgi:hypothetical protein
MLEPLEGERIQKYRKPNRYKRKHYKHYATRNRHHNLAKSRGGDNSRQNIILLDIERHALLHKIFGNRTLREIIEVLERLDRAKKHQRS